MIKLTLSPRPDFLTDSFIKEQTDKFINNPSLKVWNRKDLKDALLEITFNKCAFSEVRLGEEGKYMQVEHFLPKSKYPSKVLEWGNLFPCLNVSNAKKKDLDPLKTPLVNLKTPLVNPFIDNPKDYFYIEYGRLIPRGTGKIHQKAVNTLNAYDLNNPKQFREKRYRYEKYIHSRLEEMQILLGHEPGLGIERLKQLLKSCGRQSEYAAAKSTALLKDSCYSSIKGWLKRENIWNSEWQELENELIFCSLIK